MKVNCGVCGRPKERNVCHEVVLTPQEKETLKESQLDPVDKYYYCKPCWSVLHSEHSAKFLANSLEQKLRAAGVPRAQALAKKYLAQLTELTRTHGHKD